MAYVPFGLLSLFFTGTPATPTAASVSADGGGAFFQVRVKNPLAVEAYLAMYAAGAITESELFTLIAKEV